ncbi:MAG TPA: cytochrome c, partial [Vicinamibacterales bacterium]|nr:cytochrome c [Vicinamibacterales bacterium]
MRRTVMLVAIGVVVFPLALLAGQPAPAGGYTAAQAAAGRTAYQANCASCHLADLKGSGDAAPLAGSEFMGSWGMRSPRELVSFMQLTMPPTRPGGLSQEEYVDIAAFVLQQNGAPAGAQALTPTLDAAINTFATGLAPAAAPQLAAGRGAAPAGAPAAGGGRGRGGPPPVGITVEGEVKNFVP